MRSNLWLIACSCAGVTLATAAISQSPTPSLPLQHCTRTTHISHGGQSDHVDLGGGRVTWIDWWSQEGTATDITLMECETGEALRFRVAETNMKPGRSPFDKTNVAMTLIARHEAGARVFATLERIAADLDGIARDITHFVAITESCACAALYPSERGEKTRFALPQ